MLSYQHGYHAGNMADVHKHALLAWMLAYMTAKDKPLSYLETHAGRGLYHLDAPEALKTGEAAQGIDRAEGWFSADHPYRRALTAVRKAHGPHAYPGSPLIAAELLRFADHLHLAELHPQEVTALRAALPGHDIRQQDGVEMVLSMAPPEPRRGMCLIDPSYEVKSDYTAMPRLIAALHRKWGVGVIVLWYPILAGVPHLAMMDLLADVGGEALRHEVAFPPARPGHRMTGSGLFVINPPYGLAEEAARLSAHFGKAVPQP